MEYLEWVKNKGGANLKFQIRSPSPVVKRPAVSQKTARPQLRRKDQKMLFNLEHVRK
ncbi:MAG: hypothetical protein ACK55Z_24880 [bacterium]